MKRLAKQGLPLSTYTLTGGGEVLCRTIATPIISLSLSNVTRITTHAPVPPELVHVLAEDVARPQRRDEVVELRLLAVHVALLMGGRQFNRLIWVLKMSASI